MLSAKCLQSPVLAEGLRSQSLAYYRACIFFKTAFFSLFSMSLKMAKLLSHKLFPCLFLICSDIVPVQENVEYYM